MLMGRHRKFLARLASYGMAVMLGGAVILSAGTRASPAVQSLATCTGTGASYTAAQAAQGKLAFQRDCASCHLEGSIAPALVGDDFQKKWGSQPVSELHSFIRDSMPPEGPGSLAAEEYSAIVAHLISVNGGKPGEVALDPQNSQICVLAQ